MEKDSKELFPGINLVTLEIAKTLKELGWAWETPVIIRTRTGEIQRPLRPIDCNIGRDYMYLPTISQVTEWLERWGFVFTSGYETYNGLGYYSHPKIYFKDEEIESQPEDNWWSGWNEMMLGIIPFTLEYLKNHIFDVLELGEEKKRAWDNLSTYEWMKEIGAICSVKFYDSFNHPEKYGITTRILTGKDFKNIENELQTEHS